MMRITTFVLFFLLWTNQGYSQQLSGEVVDQNGASIAFATLLLDGNAARGHIADIDGRFNIRSKIDFSFIQVSAIGYETKKIYSNTVNASEPLRIELVERAYILEEAVVVAGENPAHRIIRKAVAKKNENNPEKLESYSCKVYNKLIGDFFRPAENKNAKIRWGKFGHRMDTLFRMRADHLLSMNEDKHIFLMESVVERKFKAPKHQLENILNNRISGLKSPTFSAIIHSLQPFSFYENYVEVLGKDFLNPLSPNSEHQYVFKLVDTLFQQQDSIFVITFTPRSGKIFNGLTGVLHIHTDNYALQLLQAEPTVPGSMNLKLEQLYDRVDDHWFPIQLNIEIEASKYPSPHLGTKFSGRSYIDEIEINPPLRNRDFPLDGIAMSKGNTDRSDSLWYRIRSIPLSPKEAKTYQWLDSLGAKNNIDKKLKIFDALVQGSYRIGPINWNIFRSFRSNEVEGFRPGLRLVTNDALSEDITLGVYAGYGLRDKRWKYKGDISWTIMPRREGVLNLFYSNDVLEPGRFEIDQPGELLTSRVYSRRFDLLESYGGSFSVFFLPYTQGAWSLEKQFFRPDYFYTYQTEDGAFANQFNITEAAFKMRFAYAERYTELFGTRMRTESNYPFLQLDMRKGLAGFANGNYDYFQLKSSLEGTFRLGRLGLSSFALMGGFAEGDLPLPKLFSTTGLDNQFGFLIEDFGFRTTQSNEFLSDRFVFLFFRQELGTLLNVHRFFRPTFIIEQNMGWGRLEHPQRHIGQNFSTMEAGFYETGLVIDNLLCLNYFSLGYFGLGAGAWYRYGPLQRPLPLDNWGVKITLNFKIL